MKRIKVADFLYVALLLCVTLICYRLFYRMSIGYQGKYDSDFTWYINLPTADNKERYRLLGWLFDLMHRMGFAITTQVVYLAAVIAFIMVANYIFLKFFNDSNCERTLLQFASILIPFIGPIFITSFHEYYYRWSFQTFAWHSPTEQSMILFSIPALICFIKMYEGSETGKVSIKWWILTMLTGLLSAFAKPAFIIDLIIAMVVVFLIDLFIPCGKSYIDCFKDRIIMGTSLIPSGLYIIVVMYYDFNGQEDMYNGGIRISLKHVFEYNNLFAAVICGLAFAIVVWSVNYKLIQKKRYRIVFFVFLTGVLQWMFFVEDGIRAGHGNFTWGRQVGCYFLVLTSVAIAINNWKKTDDLFSGKTTRVLYFMIIVILFALHVISQFHYFKMIYNGHSYMC